MSKSQMLQLHQFEINQNNILDRELYVYSWPEKLINIVLNSNNGVKLKYPIRNLSELITLAIDYVIYTRNNVRLDRYWIFSLKEISAETVTSLIQEWLLVNEIKSLSISELRIENPVKITTKDLFDEPYKYDIFGLIPQLYNFEFCSHKIEMPSLNNRELEFLPVIGTKREALAISKTFDYPVKKTDVERFSYAITSRLVYNREFPDKMFLNIYTGIKVWVCKPLVNIQKLKNFIPGKHSSSVYIYKENEYLNNKRKKLVELMYIRDEKNHYKFNEFADSIFANLLKLDLFEAITNPNEHSDFASSDSNDIILLTNNKVTEKVQYGAGLPERLDIFNAFKALFPDLIVRELIGVAHVNGRAITKKKKSLEDIEGLNNQYDDLEFIDTKSDKSFYENPPVFIPHEDKIIIEIFTSNDRLIDAFIEFAVKILSLNMPIDKYNYRSCDGYEVEFVTRNENICRGLTKAEQKNRNLRKNEIKDLLKSDNYDSKHIISLIDIEAFHLSGEDKVRDQDPKKIIRSAFKDQGRVTQFINGFEKEDKDDKYRLVSSLYDLFSAAGFMDYEYFKHGFDSQVFLGLSTCKSSRGNFIVLSKIENGQVTYKVCGLSDNEWLPLSGLLPKLQWYTLKNIEGLKIDKGLFQQWITDQLNSLNDYSKEYLFYFDASLRRSYWPFAMNSDLKVENLRLVNPENFKLIRVNTTSEVPEYNIFKDANDTEGINRNQGLFSNDYKVFYSVGARPDTIRVNKKETKITDATKMITKQRIVEFVILTDDPEENLLLAAKSHALRKLNLTFDFSTKYPLPLYANDRFGEYLELY
ncbi:protein of unknown function [Anaerovirgula multivorans]|uniref:Piwi domain-containing protein n=1 Tax=Anaerovirgula multivorans TaxID=312168 RepID=A0A239GKM5_9FIRM|nr:DUF3962 domain-containing protein [Anaerovirgula multivorans]SNS69846.1 protein of unknown function [Anaerovirgula multivorans]